MTEGDGEIIRDGRPRDRIVARLFGDRLGLTVFVGALCFFIVCWRIGFLVSDSRTIANLLVNVAEGRLRLAESPYSLVAGTQPGLIEVGGQQFGRNYGQALFALPVLWALEALSWVADPRVLVAGGWSLLFLAFVTLLGRETDRVWLARAGVPVALAAFAGNVTVATDVGRGQLPLLALQTTTMVVTAFGAVFLYRLLARFHGRRLGAAAGATLVLATPIGFWASIPKRHVLTATVALVTLYCFAASRTDRRVWTRATAYGLLGLLTLVHPFEAMFLFLVFAPLDVLTAPGPDVRSLGVIGGVFLLSLVPLFVVNTLVTGNPLVTPRMVDGYGLADDTPVPAGESGSETGAAPTGENGTRGTPAGVEGTPAEGEQTSRTPGEGEQANGTSRNRQGSREEADGLSEPSGVDGRDTGRDGTPPFGVLLATLVRTVGFAGRIAGFVVDSVLQGVAKLTDTGLLYHTLLRSGTIPGIGEVNYVLNDYEMIELTVLETTPVLAALVWLPATAVQQARESVPITADPQRQTDLLAAGYGLVFTTVYLPYLPLPSQITMRYLLPVVPLALYGVARLRVIRRAVASAHRWLVGGYVATVLVGGPVLAGLLWWLDPAVGEAMQFHALMGLATAGIGAVCTLSWPVHRDARIPGVGLALAAGATTLFLLFSALEYFAYGPHALDLVRLLADSIPIL